MTKSGANRTIPEGEEVAGPWAQVAWTVGVFMYLWALIMNFWLWFFLALIFFGVFGGLFCFFLATFILGAASTPLIMLLMIQLLPWSFLAMLVLAVGHFVLRYCGRNGFFSGSEGTSEDGALRWQGGLSIGRSSFRKRVIQG